MYSKIKYIFLILLVFFIFPQEVFSAPVIKIDNFPTTVISGQEFDINFSVSGLSIDTNYYAKSLGGIDFNEVDTWNSSWLQQNAAWSSMPIFASNTEGSASGILKSRFAITTLEGNKDYKIRIRKTNATTNYDSDLVSILINTPSPSPSPTATATPTSTLSPTLKPTPTKSPTPQPTKSPTPKSTTSSTPTGKPTEEPVQTIEPLIVLNTKTPIGIVAGAKTTEKSPILAIILIICGVGFLGYGGYLLYNMKNAKDTEVG